MTLLTFDLDDTLMTCGHDYADAKQQFGEFVAARTGTSVDDAIETLDEIDKQNVADYGLSKDRFPQSFVEACQQLVDDPTDADLETVREFGYSVFKTEAEYADRGFMDGAEDALHAIQDGPFHLHLITAGDTDVQQRKIDGLGLDEYFDDTHIVPIDTKQDRLTQLMAAHDVTPERTYHVGNSLTSDVQAALDVGANAVYIPTHEWRDVDDAAYYRTHEDVCIYESLAALAADLPAPFQQPSPV